MKTSLKPLRTLACAALCAVALGGMALASAANLAANATHRYVIERTFAAGALDGLDADAKAKVNQNNARFGVKWLMSFANRDKTKTFCIYEAPTEEAIRQAAAANHLPVGEITEVPVTLESH